MELEPELGLLSYRLEIRNEVGEIEKIIQANFQEGNIITIYPDGRKEVQPMPREGTPAKGNTMFYHF